MRARAASAPLAGWAAGRAAGSGAPGGGGAPPAGQAPPRAQRPQSPGAAAPSRAARRLRVRRRRGGRERGPAQSPPPPPLVAGLPRGSGRGAGGSPAYPPLSLLADILVLIEFPLPTFADELLKDLKNCFISTNNKRMLFVARYLAAMDAN